MSRAIDYKCSDVVYVWESVNGEMTIYSYGILSSVL